MGVCYIGILLEKFGVIEVEIGCKSYLDYVVVGVVVGNMLIGWVIDWWFGIVDDCGYMVGWYDECWVGCIEEVYVGFVYYYIGKFLVIFCF